MSKTKRSAVNVHAAHKRAIELSAARKQSESAALVAETAASRQAADKATRALEPWLRQTVWPEYGYLSAFRRTELFTQVYDEAYRAKLAQYFDYASADGSKPINRNFLKNSQQEMTALWHARQQADRLGVPYPFFIRQSMEQAIQRWTNKRVPRPNQLWRESTLLSVVRAWNTECETRSFLPSSAWDKKFRSEWFRGDEPQMALLDLIERDVLRGGKSGGASRLKAHLFTRSLITELEARRRFGDALVNQVLMESDDLLVQKTSVGTAYRPSCLGLVDEQDAPGCSGCPLSAICRKVVDLTKKDLTARFGSDDPKAHKVLIDTRERVRKFRARKRAAQSGNAAA